MNRYALPILLVTLWSLGVLQPGESLAHTSRIVAIDSNILVFDGKVLFAQGTGSLTLLSLDNGSVRLRKSLPEECRLGGTFFKHKLGVLVADYGRTALLDTDTLDIIWTIEKSHDVAIGNDYFLSDDGEHTVSCFEIATGKRVWSTTMQGGWQIRTAGNFSIVSTPLFYDEMHAMKLFQLDTGREMFHRQAKDGERFLNVYFDGKSVYALIAPHDAPTVDCEPAPKSLIEIGLDGRQLRTIDFQSGDIIGEYGYKTSRHGFFFEGRYFSGDGTVRDAYPHEPGRWAAEWGKKDASTETIPAGVLVERTIRDKAGESGTLLQLVTGKTNWTGYVAYSDEARSLVRYIQAQKRLVFASGGGHVECIDVATGKSQWLYVFPVIRRTTSYSSHAMPPMLTEQAAAYRRGLAKLGANAGTLRIPDDTDLTAINLAQFRNSAAYPGKITIDPKPDDPFANLVPKLVYRAAAFGAVPVVIMPFVISATVRRRRKAMQPEGLPAALQSKDYRLFSRLALTLAAVPFAGIMLYGRVDPLVTKCLWSVVGLAFVFFFYFRYKVKAAR